MLNSLFPWLTATVAEASLQQKELLQSQKNVLF